MKHRKSIMRQYIGDHHYYTDEGYHIGMKKDRSNDRKIGHPINESLIGHLIIEFNGLDFCIEHIICQFISDRSDEPGMIIVRSMSYSEKCIFLYQYWNRWLSIYGSKSDKLKEQVKLINIRLQEIGTFRNKVVHGDWESRDEYGYIRIGKTDFTHEGIVIEEVKILNGDIRSMISKIQSIRLKIDNISDKIISLQYD